MKEEYANWIAEHASGDVTAKCRGISLRMQEAFPELIRVRGNYHCLLWGRRAHWWLKTEDGEIVDPTASQFPSKGAGDYEEWREGDPEPTEKCMNCGEYVYDGTVACSDECKTDLCREYSF